MIIQILKMNWNIDFKINFRSIFKFRQRLCQLLCRNSGNSDSVVSKICRGVRIQE